MDKGHVNDILKIKFNFYNSIEVFIEVRHNGILSTHVLFMYPEQKQLACTVILFMTESVAKKTYRSSLYHLRSIEYWLLNQIPFWGIDISLSFSVSCK